MVQTTCMSSTCSLNHVVLDRQTGMFVNSCPKFPVARMVKYTGYGNSAGLLANRGLLLGGQTQQVQGDYSSDSEDSETEEYSNLAER